MGSLNGRPGRHLEDRACDFWGARSLRSQQSRWLHSFKYCFYLPNNFPSLITFYLYCYLERWNTGCYPHFIDSDPNVLAVLQTWAAFFCFLCFYAWCFIHLEFPHPKLTCQSPSLPWGAYLRFCSLTQSFSSFSLPVAPLPLLNPRAFCTITSIWQSLVYSSNLHIGLGPFEGKDYAKEIKPTTTVMNAKIC